MKKEMVQIVIALAVIMTAAAVFRVAEDPVALGSLGEWVSGLGAILAAVIALWIADDQRRQATAQFAEERRHATEMANDERRYNEALARAERNREEVERRRRDYQTGVWIFRNVSTGVRLLVDFSDKIIEDPSKRKAFSSIIISNRSVASASRILEALGPQSFSDPKLSSNAARLLSLWNVHLFAVEWVNSSNSIKEHQVVGALRYDAFQDHLNAMISMLRELDPDGPRDGDHIGSNGWSTWIYPES